MSADGDARMTYPFEGVIKMKTIKDEDGNDKVVWARIDKDLNVVHLDMDLCAQGPANAYTALGVGIWNAAIKSEREKVAEWMMERGYATGHGDTIEDLLNELDWQVTEREREACAKAVEAEAHMFKTLAAAKSCANAIRARGAQ